MTFYILAALYNKIEMPPRTCFLRCSSASTPLLSPHDGATSKLMQWFVLNNNIPNTVITLYLKVL